MGESVRVHGLRELQVALKEFDGTLKKRLRKDLAAAAEPVAKTAQGLASSSIENIGVNWARMRVGVTNTSVYVAPKSRRRGGSPRPNLAPLLMAAALEPALEQNQEQIVTAVEALLGVVADEYGF